MCKIGIIIQFERGLSVPPLCSLNDIAPDEAVSAQTYVCPARVMMFLLA